MALTQISTKGIKDGTILNEDISNSAAIAASKVSGLSTDSITEGNSKAEVIGSGTNDGEFKVTLQDATSSGAGAVSLHQYTSGSYNITELNPSTGNISANSSLIFNHSTATNAWSNILFNKSGASTGQSQIRCLAGTAFQFYPASGNYMLQLNDSFSTFGNTVVPNGDSNYDIGQNTNRWRNVYADDYYGSGANLTNLPAAQLTGALPAIDGSNLTGVSSVGGATGADFNDNVKIRFGDSNDLEIYHAGGDSKIEHTTSGTDLRLITSGSGDDILIQPNDDFLVQVAGATKNAIICRNDGATELYHQGNSNSEKKFVTTSTGARVENTSSPLTSANSSANEFVVTGDGAMGMTLHTTNTSSNCGIHFADGTSGNATYRGTVIYRHLHDQLRFGVNGGTLAQQINSDLTVSFQNTIYASSFSTASDLNLKSNLVRFTNTLDKLKELNGYTFDIKVGEEKDITIASAGIIAQDVEKVFPELVSTETGSDYKTVQYNGLIGVLVEAVKELTTKVAALEAA